jgi:hypothetical protein
MERTVVIVYMILSFSSRMFQQYGESPGWNAGGLQDLLAMKHPELVKTTQNTNEDTVKGIAERI